MAQYNSLNVKLSNSQLNKLKSAIKNETEAVLRLSSNMVGDDEKYIPHKLLLLLTNRQVANFRKGFANYLSQLILSYQKLKYVNDTIRRISWQTYWSITKIQDYR